MRDTQTTLSIAGFARFGRPMRRKLFLTQMDKFVPWAELLQVPSLAGGASTGQRIVRTGTPAPGSKAHQD